MPVNYSSRELFYSVVHFMLLPLLKAAVMPGYNWIGAITPIGGLCFIAGWICLFFGMFKKQASRIINQ